MSLGDTPGISTEGLAKRFGRGSAITRLLVRAPRHDTITALEEVTFALGPGEVAALVGPNGAGKSTLLRVLATLLLPDAGTATLAGHDVATEPVAVRRAMAFVTADDRSFSWRLTGRENLEFFVALYGMRGGTVRVAVDGALERASLVDAGDDAFATYSSGMRQRLALARGLATHARVLLLDEPFRSLDDESSARLRTMLSEATDTGATALVATHHLDDLSTLTTRVLDLNGGRLRYDGPPEGWLSDRAAVAAPTITSTEGSP